MGYKRTVHPPRHSDESVSCSKTLSKGLLSPFKSETSERLDSLAMAWERSEANFGSAASGTLQTKNNDIQISVYHDIYVHNICISHIFTSINISYKYKYDLT